MDVVRTGLLEVSTGSAMQFGLGRLKVQAGAQYDYISLLEECDYNQKEGDEQDMQRIKGLSEELREPGG